jgi:kojibiose phosphorylase
MSDIEIEGNLEDQTLIRFNLYHNIIATPTHAHLPIGARGLSTQVYQGAAFWDQEIFNLPMFIYTQPDLARNILEYRFFTLEGARAKANRLGYRGAFYAWTSGKTGEELFPDFFFTDVLTGRKIRNHFNDWQIHISSDIVYAVWKYYLASGDKKYLFSHGAEIFFEVSRFLYSYSYFNSEKNRFEFIRLLGPDEYHENVDNNAFTNYQAHYTLEKSIQLFYLMREQEPEILEELTTRLQLTDHELSGWQRMKDLLYLPEPDPKTRLIEQFDRYFDLEDIFPDQVRKRLIDPDEYWGWPNGIAVHTQVLKQADVIQLLALHEPFSPAIIKANYEYYEPRTEHGSSLSPSVHSLVACKAEHPQQAYRYFKESASIDLYHKSKKIFSGGSFLGGIHTAACGAVWMMVVMGFAGFRQREDQHLEFDPHLPENWKSVRFQLIIRNHQMSILITSEHIKIESRSGDCEPLIIEVRGNADTLQPRKSLGFELE